MKPYPEYRDSHCFPGRLTKKYKADLKNSVSNFITWHEYFYIGISNNPERRNYQHYKNGKGHSKMEVLYVSSSPRMCKKLEAELVAYYNEHAKYCGYNKNKKGGGGGPDGLNGPYYLYILLWD